MSKEIKITTECKDCIFAEWENSVFYSDDYMPNMQISCSLNRLEKFVEQGLAEKTKEKNAEKFGMTPMEYFTINTMCNAKRDQEWADQFEDPKTEVQKQIQITNDFIILSYNDDNLGPNLIQSAKQCLRQTIPPKIIIFVVRAEKIPRFKEIFEDLNTIIDGKVEFYFVRIVDPDKTPDDCINEVFSRVKSFYCTIWESGKEIPVDYNKRLNDLVNEEMRKVSMVCSGGYHGLTLQSNLHDIFKYSTNIQGFITDIAKDQGFERMVIPYEEV